MEFSSTPLLFFKLDKLRGILVASEGLVAMFLFVLVWCIYMNGLWNMLSNAFEGRSAEMVLLLVLVSLFLRDFCHPYVNIAAIF